jgi:hypothetical protein
MSQPNQSFQFETQKTWQVQSFHFEMQKLESRLGRGDSVQLGQIVEKVFHITLSSGWHRLKVRNVIQNLIICSTKRHAIVLKTNCLRMKNQN